MLWVANPKVDAASYPLEVFICKAIEDLSVIFVLWLATVGLGGFPPRDVFDVTVFAWASTSIATRATIAKRTHDARNIFGIDGFARES
jgi:hypothetical protein